MHSNFVRWGNANVVPWILYYRIDTTTVRLSESMRYVAVYNFPGEIFERKWVLEMYVSVPRGE